MVKSRQRFKRLSTSKRPTVEKRGRTLEIHSVWMAITSHVSIHLINKTSYYFNLQWPYETINEGLGFGINSYKHFCILIVQTICSFLCPKSMAAL